MKNTSVLKFIPVILAFFAMGYVDIVGIAANYIKVDFTLSDTMTNALGSMLFLWFLVISIPTGILMNKIGRRKTVALSTAITFIAMIIPICGYSFYSMMLSFALLGISNTLLQVSVNPLVADMVSPEKLASSITLGQFVKAIASFSAPLVALWGAEAFGNWRIVYPLFAAVALVPSIWLLCENIEESVPAKNSSFSESFALLKNPIVAFLFFGILIHVGIDVGVNISAPKILIERTEMTLSQAGYATSLYFFFRIATSFVGAFILAKMSAKKFFIASIAIMAIASFILFFAKSTNLIYICIALMGIGNANIFSIIFTKAIQAMPSHKNEVSSLMIMGVSGGAIFPLCMGIASDFVGSQNGAIMVIILCIAYLAFLSTKLNSQNS